MPGLEATVNRLGNRNKGLREENHRLRERDNRWREMAGLFDEVVAAYRMNGYPAIESINRIWELKKALGV